MPDIIDVSFDCGSSAGFLAGAGVKTVIRYYSRDTGLPHKRLTRREAEQHAAAGLRLGVVHEARHGDKATSFSHDLGLADADHVLDYGFNVIRQVAGSAIYFGVDFDATRAELGARIEPYFEAIGSVFGARDPGSRYRIGVYGSGLVCQHLMQAGLVELTWLAQSTGWAEFRAFKASQTWTLSQGKAGKVGEIGCDPDERNPDGRAIGDFALNTVPDHAGVAALGEKRVIAGAGLRLRAGPGTEFDVLTLLPFGKTIGAMKVVGDWTMADVDGDGAADGFVSSHFLA